MVNIACSNSLVSIDYMTVEMNVFEYEKAR